MQPVYEMLKYISRIHSPSPCHRSTGSGTFLYAIPYIRGAFTILADSDRDRCYFSSIRSSARLAVPAPCLAKSRGRFSDCLREKTERMGEKGWTKNEVSIRALEDQGRRESDRDRTDNNAFGSGGDLKKDINLRG